MLASSSKNFGKSTATSKLSTSLTASKVQKDSFIIFCYKKLVALFSSVWGKTRKTLWIFSTGILFKFTLGFILLILPFTFAYISEFQKEAAKIMGGN